MMAKESRPRGRRIELHGETREETLEKAIKNIMEADTRSPKGEWAGTIRIETAALQDMLRYQYAQGRKDVLAKVMKMLNKEEH